MGFPQQVFVEKLAWALGALLGAANTIMNKTDPGQRSTQARRAEEHVKWNVQDKAVTARSGVCSGTQEHMGGAPGPALKSQGRLLRGERDSSALNTKLYNRVP